MNISCLLGELYCAGRSGAATVVSRCFTRAGNIGSIGAYRCGYVQEEYKLGDGFFALRRHWYARWQG